MGLNAVYYVILFTYILEKMEQQIKHIGKLEGKVWVFGGTYSNLASLKQLKALSEEHDIPPQNIINTGDIAGYCGEPEECLQLIKNWGIHNILGNVEIQLRDQKDDCGCDFDEESRCHLFSKQWFPYVQKKVSEDSLDWLHKIPQYIHFNFADKKIGVLHGSFFNTSEYIFKSTDWDKKAENFKAMGVDVILSGHCGLPFSDQKNQKYWLNAGVIGMPANEGLPRVWALEIDDADNTFSFSHYYFDYDHKKTYKSMMENNLPEAYAKTILNGIWDNCEILPEEETLLCKQNIHQNK